MSAGRDSAPATQGQHATGLLGGFLRLFGFRSTRGDPAPLIPNKLDEAPDPARCVIFIGGVRTGTTVFREMLASHPAIVDRHEIFNTQNRHGFYPFLRELVRTEPDAVFPEHAMKNFARFLASGCEPAKISVFDLKYEHLLHLPIAWQLPFTDPHILRFIASQGIKVIHLRRNPLHSLISNLIAHRSKHYHLYRHPDSETPQSEASGTIRVDRARIEESIKIRQQVTALVDEVFRPTQRINFDYESIFNAEGQFRDEVCAELASFIGIEDLFDRQPQLGKVITRPLSEIVENYAEISDLEQT